MNCEFDAWYNRMPGTDDYDLHVAGRVTVRSSSIEVWLAPGNQGINPQKNEYILELHSKSPDYGDDRITEKEVEWHGSAPGTEVKTVIIGGECQARVQVRDAS